MSKQELHVSPVWLQNTNNTYYDKDVNIYRYPLKLKLKHKTKVLRASAL